jgi:hypothetical protein
MTPLEIAMKAGSWFDRKDLFLQEREVEVARLITEALAAQREADAIVTDEMVERATAEYFANWRAEWSVIRPDQPIPAWDQIPKSGQDATRRCMRVALAAAIRTQQDNKET